MVSTDAFIVFTPWGGELVALHIWTVWKLTMTIRTTIHSYYYDL